MNNLAIIVNDSDIYLDKRVEETYQQWGFNYTDMIKADEWLVDSGGITSLFTKPFTLLNLTDNKNLKKFKEFYDKHSKTDYFKKRWYGNGLIIIAKDGRGSWLSKLAETSDGFIEKKLTPDQIKSQLNQSMNLPRNIINFINEFVGEDYEDLYIIMNALEGLSNEKRKSLTIEELFTYLPSQKGAVPPWKYIEAVLQRNTKKAVEEYNRVTEQLNPIPLLSILKTKLSKAYIYTVTKQAGADDQTIIKLLGFKSTYALKDFRPLTVKGTKAAILDLLQAEHEIKGGGAINTKQRIETLTVQITIDLNRR